MRKVPRHRAGQRVAGGVNAASGGEEGSLVRAKRTSGVQVKKERLSLEPISVAQVVKKTKGDAARPSSSSSSSSSSKVKVETVQSKDRQGDADIRRAALLKRKQQLENNSSSDEEDVDEMTANFDALLGKVDGSQDSSSDDDDDSSSSSGSSSSSSSSSSDDGYYARPLEKPTFVSKSSRTTIKDAATIQQEAIDQQILKEKQVAEEQERSKKLVENHLLEDAAKEARKHVELPPEDENDGDPEEEYAKWKIRELMRVRRDLKERKAEEKRLKETKRRREMTDAEVMAEDANKKRKAAKTKRKFMQKYYHRGAFYQEELEQAYDRRAFDGATGLDAEIDKSTLPQMMQVRDKWGLSGRTKYTNLGDQDTTSREDRRMYRQMNDALKHRPSSGSIDGRRKRKKKKDK